MREILFRGKRTDNGEWVKGDLIQLRDEIKYIVNNKFGACIDDKGNFINTEYPFVCEIIPETIGQDTGLTDKNGKKIFEGDICEYDDTIGVVEFCEDNAMFTFTYDENIEADFSCLWGKDLAVIGNIHDNPRTIERRMSMTDNITDNEIIKALECCIKVISDCNNCPYYDDDDCKNGLIGNALDLIKRKDAEIERLKIELEVIRAHQAAENIVKEMTEVSE